MSLLFSFKIVIMPKQQKNKPINFSHPYYKRGAKKIPDLAFSENLNCGDPLKRCLDPLKRCIDPLKRCIDPLLLDEKEDYSYIIHDIKCLSDIINNKTIEYEFKELDEKWFNYQSWCVETSTKIIAAIVFDTEMPTEDKHALSRSLSSLVHLTYDMKMNPRMVDEYSV